MTKFPMAGNRVSPLHVTSYERLRKGLISHW